MASPARRGTAAEVFRVFLRLGLTSFGGPVAHLGYFRTAFVERRGWLGDAAFAEIVALCQFLPGPASSQAGFAIGLHRAGWRGALAAWLGFTLPSAMLMFAAAAYGAMLTRAPAGAALIHGLKLAAVAVVAQAVVAMARLLAPDLPRAAIALAGLGLVLAWPAAGQLPALALGALAGLWLCRGIVPSPAGATGTGVSRRAGFAALVLFALLLAGGPLLAAAGGSPAAVSFAAFYRAGALVFGGGHVVLPLLSAGLVDPGLIAPDTFLAGYGAAQALPGPLFTIATYLGFFVGPGGVGGAALATIAIFLPGLLLLVAALPFQARLRTSRGAQAALRGASAAVVGILGAALYDPLWGAVRSGADAAVVAAAAAILIRRRAPPVAVVAACALAGLAGLALQVAQP